MEKDAKIFIAGHEGMVASAIGKLLREKGYAGVIEKNADELNLLDVFAVKDFFQIEKPDYVFLPSYKSGSIQANIDYPAEFIYENLVVQNNIIHNAYLSGVKKLLFFGASCIYPKESPQPIKEEYLLTGELEPTSRPYAVAKIAGIEMCHAYNKQYKTKFISVIPATIYGPGDKFDAENSHVLSGLIRKFHEAKIKNQNEVVLWGSGNPKREFLYVDDLAEACVFLMNGDFDVDTFNKLSINPERSRRIDLINIGSGVDFAIKKLADKIKEITGFQGEIKWDSSKPNGVMKKLLAVNRLNSLGWKSCTELDDGINKTYKWFIDNYDRF